MCDYSLVNGTMPVWSLSGRLSGCLCQGWSAVVVGISVLQNWRKVDSAGGKSYISQGRLSRITGKQPVISCVFSSFLEGSRDTRRTIEPSSGCSKQGPRPMRSSPRLTGYDKAHPTCHLQSAHRTIMIQSPHPDPMPQAVRLHTSRSGSTLLRQFLTAKPENRSLKSPRPIDLI